MIQNRIILFHTDILKNVLFKIDSSSINRHLSMDEYLSSSSSRPSSAFSLASGFSAFSTGSQISRSSSHIENKIKTQNIFTGFGFSLNNRVAFVTYYTYLVCYEARTGSLLRVFQSTVSANRIVKSYKSRLSDILVSVLDTGKLVCWNLASVELKGVKFSEFKVYNEPVKDCLIPNRKHNTSAEPDFFISYSSQSPDANMHDLTAACAVSGIVRAITNGDDNPLACRINSIVLDENGHFCFVICDVEEFIGKQLPEEKDFIKRLCTLIDLTQGTHSIIQQFSFIIKKNSRF